MTPVTTTTTIEIDLNNPVPVDLTALPNVQKDKVLKLLSEFLYKFNYVQHLEDCYDLTNQAQEHGFQLPLNFYYNSKFAINLHSEVREVVSRKRF